MRPSPLLLLCMSAAIGLSGSGGARAETLADAIALAYQTNPTLQGQRAQLRAVDETYTQARAALGPTVQAEVTETYNTSNLQIPQFLPPNQIGTNTTNGTVTVTQPLYNGGRSAAAINGAQARVYAGREQLRATEGNVVLAVITAYADVLRDQQALAVRQKHLEMLGRQVDIANARRAAGEGTVTDIAQAQAQVAAVRALVADAQNQLQVSRAAYATVVGQNPGDLAPEPDLPGLPAAVEAAFAAAEQQNPDLQQAKYAEQISREQVVAARAAFRPSVSLNGSAGYGLTTQPFFGRSNSWNVTAGATVSEQLFANGQRTSAVREALEQNESDRIAIESARRTMVQNLANAWNLMITARGDVALQQEQVRAASAAFDGMQIEYNAGERTTQDVLLAEETLRNAELSLLAAQRDAYVGAATVLRHVGRLQGANMVADLPQYDPAQHFRAVRGKDQVPWTGLVRGIDSIAEPAASVHRIPAPAGAVNPTSAPAGAPVPADAPLATALPMTPAPGTASPQPPPKPSPGP